MNKICDNIAYLGTELTIRWLLSGPNPVGHGDLIQIEKRVRHWVKTGKKPKTDKTFTLFDGDIPSEDILSISSSQNNTQTVRKKENIVVLLLT